MNIDSLIEPSEIVVEQLDKASTVYDADAREPIKQVRRATAVTLEAQVSWTRNRRVAFKLGAQGGAQDEAGGYLVFLRRDVIAAGVTLQRGDRITSIAGVAVDPPLFLTNEQRAGHLSGTANLEIWDFADRRPTSG